MAEAFQPVNYTTGLDRAQVEGKSLWLFRIPRHIPSSSLEGAKIKLRSRKDREGKVVGRINDDTSSALRGGLVLKSADAAESTAFRALWTEATGQLVAARPFVGQVNISLTPPSPSADTGVPENVMARVVEPYQGRPQLQGMRVRSKLAGAGTEYVRIRSTDADMSSSPLRQDGGGHGASVTLDETDERQDIDSKGGSREDDTRDSSIDADGASPSASPKAKKRAKRKISSVREASSETGGSGVVVQKEPSTAVKVKKSKKKERRSL